MRRRRGADWYFVALLASIGFACIGLTGCAWTLGALAHAVSEAAHAVRGAVRP
ncbi:MAG TPA: hypothetical protein VF474_16440 [Phenylobacterium sp.]